MKDFNFSFYKLNRKFNLLKEKSWDINQNDTEINHLAWDNYLADKEYYVENIYLQQSPVHFKSYLLDNKYIDLIKFLDDDQN